MGFILIDHQTLKAYIDRLYSKSFKSSLENMVRSIRIVKDAKFNVNKWKENSMIAVKEGSMPIKSWPEEMEQLRCPEDSFFSVHCLLDLTIKTLSKIIQRKNFDVN